MIEPLRYLKETLPTYEVERPVFCTNCLGSRQTRNNPNLATVFCQQCTFMVDDVQEDGAYLCKVCCDSLHKHNLNTDHVRQIIVVGPSVRKKVIVRGDGVNFPLPLDSVVVNMKARVYHNGQRVHTEKKKTLSFITGMSGKCIHVQILGAQDLKGRDLTGSSDPFVVYSYCGKPVASTRVKPRNCNPRWNNETFVVPIDESMPYPRNMLPSQKDLIKFEVFDHDWITQNDFLGHLEIPRSKLMKLAVVANEQPIRLALTNKECHGILSVQFACDNRYFYVRVLSAEDLDKQDLFQLASPYCKVFIGEKTVLGSTPVLSNTIHPIWTSGHEFRIRLSELLESEALLDTQLRLHRASAGMGTQRRERRIFSPVSDGFQEFSALPEFLALVRVEVFDRRPWRGDQLLGKACVYADQLRRVLPDLPTQNEFLLAQQQQEAAAAVAAPPLHKLLSGSLRGPLKDSFKGLRPPSFRSPRGQRSDSNTPTPPAATTTTTGLQRRPSGSSSSEEDEEDEEDEEGVEEGRGPGRNRDGDEVDTVARAHTPPPTRLASLWSHLGWRASLAGGGEAPDRPQSAPSTTRGLTLAALAARPLTGGSSGPDERVWSAVQRLQLLRFSMQSYVASLGLGRGNTAGGQGALIVRLLVAQRGHVAVGLDEGVRRMTLGETALVKCRFDAFYGHFTLAPSLPPRSNVVLQLRLVEVNGRGRLGVPSRIMRRLYRLVWGLLLLLLRVVWTWYHPPVEPKAKDDARGADSHRRRKMSRRWTRFSFLSLNLQPGGEDDSEDSDAWADGDEDEDGEEEDDDEDGEGRDGAAGGRGDGGTSTVAGQIAQAHPAVRKHLTGAVVTGAKLVFNVEKTAARARAIAPPKSYAVDELTAQLQRLQALQQEAHRDRDARAERAASREERGEERFLAVEGVEDGEERAEAEEEAEEDRLEEEGEGAEAGATRPGWRRRPAGAMGSEEREEDEREHDNEEEDEDDEEEEDEDEEEEE